MTLHPLLTVIPARGGSKGLPDKNIRSLSGIPLIGHSILCAKMCSELDRVIVSSDDDKIISIAREFDVDIPFKRPAELAEDNSSMIDVIKHALLKMEEIDSLRYEAVLLLDPTSPGRMPQDITQAIEKLKNNPNADGIVGVSVPEFNPIWHSVIEENGFMKSLISDAVKYTRRQDVPIVYRINASLYIWRRDYLLSCKDNWIGGKHLIYEIPETRAIHIDELFEFKHAEVLLQSGLISFPWMKS